MNHPLALSRDVWTPAANCDREAVDCIDPMRCLKLGYCGWWNEAPGFTEQESEGT
jgi:hypothetical protein